LEGGHILYSEWMHHQNLDAHNLRKKFRADQRAGDIAAANQQQEQEQEQEQQQEIVAEQQGQEQFDYVILLIFIIYYL